MEALGCLQRKGEEGVIWEGFLAAKPEKTEPLLNSPMTLNVNVLFSRAPGAWHVHVPASCQLTSLIVWVSSGCVLFSTSAPLLLSSVAADGGFPFCQRQCICRMSPRATLPLASETSSRMRGGSVQRKPTNSLCHVMVVVMNRTCYMCATD